MNYEFITIIVTILLAWGSQSLFLWTSLKDIHRDIGELRERMARLEGLFEGFTGRNAA